MQPELTILQGFQKEVTLALGWRPTWVWGYRGLTSDTEAIGFAQGIVPAKS